MRLSRVKRKFQARFLEELEGVIPPAYSTRYLNMAEFLDKQIFDTESKLCSSAESTVVSIADY